MALSSVGRPRGGSARNELRPRRPHFLIDAGPTKDEAYIYIVERARLECSVEERPIVAVHRIQAPGNVALIAISQD